ncbi:MAG: hypothetical protein PHD97_05925 [Bacteroidales bacterium]|nr:hypothetical protein [Bacteroidales bacterium]
MRNIILKSLTLLFLLPSLINAQDKKEEPKFGIKFSGFVKTDVFYDSRQTINLREGHFLLYPDNILLDENKNDINEKPNFNMLSIQSRLKGTISGPDAFKAKTSGVIEADFFGNSGSGLDDVNGFRVRHAFVKMSWKTTELLAGQYWHPMFIAESFPMVISFNTGAPFQPFSRNPQLRLTQKMGPLSFMLCAFAQRDFQGYGPEYNSTTNTYSSVLSTKYLRNSGIPNGHFQIQYKPDSTEHLFGFGVDYKIYTPRLYSEVIAIPAKDIVDTVTWKVTHVNAVTAKYKVDESIASLSALVFAKLVFKTVTIRIEGIYAQNATDLTMIGGYAVEKVSNANIGKWEYTNLNTGSVWGEVQTNGKKVQFGLFVGYTENMGAADSVKGNIYARGSNIDYLYRVAPRVVFISGKLSIALEGEYTFAMYGTANGDKKGSSTNNKAVANTRGLLAFIYNF